MIRRLLALGAMSAIGAVAADRALAARRADGPREPIRSFVVIDAPIDRVWAVLADIEGQPRWMREMKSVRITTPGPVGVGTRGEAEVRILGIGVTDPVSITEFDPPRRFAIRHEGTFTGGGTIELRSGADGTTTLVSWEETLIPPVLPDLVAALQRPILSAIFQADLHHFRELLETPPASSPDDLASLRMESEGGPPTPAEVAAATGIPGATEMPPEGPSPSRG